MIVRAAGGSVVVHEVEDFDRFRVETGLAPAVLDGELRARDAGYVIDDDSAAIAPSFIALHAGPRTKDAAWGAHMRAMVEHARRNGWFTDDGALVAHIVVGT
ncbi:hypothetical protein [Microbacterium sp. G2-8]|uniref:hypothetical protein n=1 Tax=Microbacterium sp. G2-8 TaxID=2842454 RepID=UPI001C8A758D|nr:hypothetical protein [Microbacterium sp. G2-8]